MFKPLLEDPGHLRSPLIHIFPKPHELKDGHRIPLAFDPYAILLSQEKAGIQPLCGGLPGNDRCPIGLVQAFESGSQVYHVPDDRVIHEMPASQIPDRDRTAIQADAHGELFDPLLLSAALHRLQPLKHIQGRLRRLPGMVLHISGGPEKGHDRIPHELIQGALVFKDDRDHGIEIEIEQSSRLQGTEAFRNGGKSPKIGKKHGHIPGPTVQAHADLPAQDIVHHARRDVLAEKIADQGGLSFAVDPLQDRAPHILKAEYGKGGGDLQPV